MLNETTPEPDEYLTFAEAAKRVPGTRNISTIHRWRLRGVRGVRLHTELYGGRRYVRASAIAAFVAATTEAGERSGDLAPRQNGQREDAILKAEQQLKEFGI